MGVALGAREPILTIVLAHVVVVGGLFLQPRRVNKYATFPFAQVHLLAHHLGWFCFIFLRCYRCDQCKHLGLSFLRGLDLSD